MSEILRYRAATCDCGDTREPEGPVTDGDWVKHADHLAEIQRLRERQTELVRLRLIALGFVAKAKEQA